MTKRTGPGEGFSFENGRWTDAGFHEAMSAGVDHVRVSRVGRLEAKLAGVSEEELDDMYGPETRADRAEAERIGFTEEELDKMFGPQPK